MRRSQYLEGLALLAIVAIGLAVRVVPYAAEVFAPRSWVRFPATDPWYFVRIAEESAAAFPRIIAHDPFMHDGVVPVAQFYPWLAAAIAWVIGFGAPSTMTVELVAAWFPPLFGVATLVALWFSARAAWGPVAGLLAALIAAIAPGEIMRRSVLGNFDQHVAETLFATAFIGLVLPQLRDGCSRSRSIASGAVLAAYLLSWRSGILMLLVFFVAALAVTWTEWSRRDESVALSIFSLAFATAAAIVLPFAGSWPVAFDSLLALAAALAVFGESVVLQRVVSHPSARIAGTVIAGVAGLVLLWLLAPEFAQRALANVHRLMPRFEATSVTEAFPLLMVPSPARLVHSQFGAAGFLAIAGLMLLAYRAARFRQRPDVFLLLFSVAIVGLFFAQVRFAYYAGIIAAMLTAFFIAAMLQQDTSVRRRLVAAAVAVVVFIAPDATRAWNAPHLPAGPGDAWHDVLTWMRQNTADPFVANGVAKTPAYTVATWWDYGYWVMRIAQRVPTANPTQSGARATARIFLAQSEEEAIASAAEVAARYLITAPKMVAATSQSGMPESLVAPMAAWAGEPRSNYVEICSGTTADGRSVRVLLFHEAYYRALGVRLQLYGTDAVVARSPSVATLASDGGAVRRIVAMRSFDSAAAARVYAAASRDRYIVGLDPAKSVVDLEPLRSIVPLRGGPEGPRLFEFRR